MLKIKGNKLKNPNLGKNEILIKGKKQQVRNHRGTIEREGSPLVR